VTGAGPAAAVVSRAPRNVAEETTPAIERLPPSPRTPPGAVQTEAAIQRRPDSELAPPSTETANPAGDDGLRSFARVHEELDRLEAAGHDVTHLCVELDQSGATLSVETEG
jgi:hypothetical protein